jgi:hypothetical protein
MFSARRKRQQQQCGGNEVNSASRTKYGDTIRTITDTRMSITIKSRIKRAAVINAIV